MSIRGYNAPEVGSAYIMPAIAYIWTEICFLLTSFKPPCYISSGNNFLQLCLIRSCTLLCILIHLLNARDLSGQVGQNCPFSEREDGRPRIAEWFGFNTHTLYFLHRRCTQILNQRRQEKATTCRPAISLAPRGFIVISVFGSSNNPRNPWIQLIFFLCAFVVQRILGGTEARPYAVGIWR